MPVVSIQAFFRLAAALPQTRPRALHIRSGAGRASFFASGSLRSWLCGHLPLVSHFNGDGAGIHLEKEAQCTYCSVNRAIQGEVSGGKIEHSTLAAWEAKGGRMSSSGCLGSRGLYRRPRLDPSRCGKVSALGHYKYLYRGTPHFCRSLPLSHHHTEICGLIPPGTEPSFVAMKTAAVLLAISGLAAAQAPPWGQCGGQGWSGPTTCTSGRRSHDFKAARG